MIATASYPMRGRDGIMHRFREKNYFQVLMQGQNVVAVCNSAAYTMDGVKLHLGTASSALPCAWRWRTNHAGSGFQQYLNERADPYV